VSCRVTKGGALPRRARQRRKRNFTLKNSATVHLLAFQSSSILGRLRNDSSNPKRIEQSGKRNPVLEPLPKTQRVFGGNRGRFFSLYPKMQKMPRHKRKNPQQQPSFVEQAFNPISQGNPKEKNQAKITV
ncbi:MAG: hypothetical protein V1777_00020, partial [Candidatus Micrarchaeota archaeon]